MAKPAEVRDLLAVLKEAGVGHYEEHPEGGVKSVTFVQVFSPPAPTPDTAENQALAALVDLSAQARAERQ